MNINDMTIREAREIAGMFGGSQPNNPCPFEVGSSYLIRTVTMAWTGKVREIAGDYLVLDQAAWIADTGRYSAATCAENLGEVEPAGDGIILGLGAVVDARPWTGTLPFELK